MVISENCYNPKELIYKQLKTKIAMITKYKVTEIFCMADDFCKFFDAMTVKYTLKPTGKRKYYRNSTMSKAEVMLIMILFHTSGYRCFKHFYLEKVCKHLRIFSKLKSNMKGALMSVSDRLLLRKRAIIEILLSAKLQNDTISLSATPINRRCGFLFRKVSPLSQRVKVRRVGYRGYPRSSTNLFRDVRRNYSSQCSTWAWYAPSWLN